MLQRYRAYKTKRQKLKTTKVFDQTISAYNSGKRLIINRGGTRSGKSFSILQLLFLIALYSQKRLVITVISHSFPHLELGVVRDLNNILLGENINPESISTKRPYVYKIGSSIIEFISVDNLGKALGAARDILFVNEANKIPHNIYHQLMIRTTGTIFLDFNPSEKFWLSMHEYDKEPDSAEIVSTYLDNIENLTIQQIEELEKSRLRYEAERMQGKSGYWTFWWKVYGMGEYGKLVDRLVFPQYTVVDKIDDRFKLKGYGLDFGFSVDPLALVANYTDQTDVLFDELLYKTGLSNVMNPEKPGKSLEEHKHLVDNSLFIVADSAEPKSIAECRAVGLNMYAVKKPNIKDSIRMMLKYNLYVTARSENMIHEFDNYLWPVDKDDTIVDGNPIGPDHAIDGSRYFLSMKNRLWV